MKIVVDVNHPAHVHYSRHFVEEMRKKGHEVMITASEKDISYRLLDSFGLDYVRLGSYGNSLFRKLIGIPWLDIKMYRAVRKFDPDIFLGFGSIRCGHVAKLLGKKSVTFDDSEHATLIHMLHVPFTDVVITPASFKRNFGPRQIYYDGFSQLAHMHPRYFKPNPAVLEHLGLSEGDKFVVVRLISWNASHDVGHHGLDDPAKVVRELERFGRVFISSEGRLDESLEQYRLRIPPDMLHDLLYYCTLYFGEGGTTAIEAALLGTHAIHVSTTAKFCGVFDDLGSYDLLWISEDTDASLELAKSLLADRDLKSKGREKLQKLLADKIDVTGFMMWFIENYPGSFESMKSDRSAQDAFRGVRP